MPARYGGLTWLAEQAAARWRRTDWEGNCNMMAEELWAVMVRLRDLEPDRGELTTPDGTITIDDVRNILEQLDLTAPEVQVPTQTDEIESPEFISTTTSRTTWERSVLLGKVLSKASGKNYNVELYPFGKLDVLNPDGTVERTNETTLLEVEVEQLQIHDAAEIPADTWVLVALFIQYKVSDTEVRLKETQQIISRFQSLEELQRAHYMQAPVWL